MPASRSDVRVDMGFGLGARMRHRAQVRRADVLRVAPQRAGVVVGAARLPGLAPLGQLGSGDLELDRARLGVDGDDVAVPRPARSGRRPAASGPTWPMQKPRVAPEKRPSVISATFSPMPWP